MKPPSNIQLWIKIKKDRAKRNYFGKEKVSGKEKINPIFLILRMLPRRITGFAEKSSSPLNRRIQNYNFFKFLISQVEVYVVFFLDKEPVNSQAFSITVGTNFELYLIVSIGFIFGFLLIITIVVMMRRRKHNSRSSEYHGEVNITNSEDQNDETLIWTNVNLNSSTRNYNTFSQIFGAGKIKVLF